MIWINYLFHNLKTAVLIWHVDYNPALHRLPSPHKMKSGWTAHDFNYHTNGGLLVDLIIWSKQSRCRNVIWNWPHVLLCLSLFINIYTQSLSSNLCAKYLLSQMEFYCPRDWYFIFLNYLKKRKKGAHF